MTILAVLATIFGSIGGLANLPQAYRIFRRKSAGDISITTYSILLAGALVWVLYGLEIGNFPVIITNVFGSVCIGLVALGWFL
ncbi:MAG: SemiSWEET family sugar transporter, partial [Candidatus Aenigmatarchaeota archaeon]